MLEKLLELFPEKCHLRLHRCFNTNANENWGFEERGNEDFHMIYVKGGKGFYTLKGSTEVLEKGKLIFISPGFRHSAGQFRRRPYPKIIPVRFGLYSNSTGKDLSPGFFRPFCACLENVSGKAFPELFEKLYKCFCMKESKLRTTMANIIMQEILLEILNALKPQSSEVDARIERVKDFILKNPEKGKTLSALAKMAELSTKYFSRLFFAQTGSTPVNFAIRARCRSAEYMLQNSSMRIKEVAARLGYPDQYSFSKQFRKTMGYPPNSTIDKTVG